MAFFAIAIGLAKQVRKAEVEDMKHIRGRKVYLALSCRLPPCPPGFADTGVVELAFESRSTFILFGMSG